MWRLNPRDFRLWMWDNLEQEEAPASWWTPGARHHRKVGSVMQAESTPQGKGLTGQQMCEFIAGVWKERYGQEIEPEAIWNASPSGELVHVFMLYEASKQWKDSQGSGDSTGAVSGETGETRGTTPADSAEDRP